jgi:TetR/AcrR family transcriptional regulator, cholesterol catabolism regulator
MSKETYQKILTSAQTLFIQNGYTATSMREIAEASGIGKATIYHHFSDKESIIKVLLEDTQQYMQKILDSISKEQEPRQRIKLAILASMDFLFANADLIQIARREVPEARDWVKGDFIGFFKNYMALISDSIRTGIKQDIFREVDPNATARVLMTMIQGTFAMSYLMNERASSPGKAADTLLDVFFKGINRA